jgi:hypothetical protein
MTFGLRLAGVVMSIAVTAYGIVAPASHAMPAEATPAVTDANAVVEEQTAEQDIRVTLPTYFIQDVLVDDVHQRVYVAGTSLVVLDFEGRIIQTITTGLVAQMTISEDWSAVYLARSTSEGQFLTVVDTSTLATRDIAVPCLYRSLAFTGGKVWFHHYGCRSDIGWGVGMFDPATDEVRTGLISVPDRQAVQVRARPDRPDRLAVIPTYGAPAVYDVSSGTPVIVAQGQPPVYSCTDAGLLSGGDLLVKSCDRKHEILRTADLSHVADIPVSDSANAVAVTPNGRYLAVGVAAENARRDITVFDITEGIPGDLVRTYDLPEGLSSRALAFNANGRLFAGGYPTESGGWFELHILVHATKYPVTATVSVPTVVDYRETVNGTGALSYAPGESTTASLTRTDRNGSQSLGSVQVAADGTFSFTDVPEVSGRVTYTVDHPGDATHDPVTASAGTLIRPLPYDVNGDGHADVVVGAPGEQLGSAAAAGMFHLLYGSSTGVQAAGSVAVHQDTPGVPGTAEPGDGFGSSSTSGDFNGDGFADVAVSAPKEAVGSWAGNGEVWVFLGSAGGLRTDYVKVLGLGDTIVRDFKNAAFGATLAVGDFDDDGRDDLTVGAPGAGPGYVVEYRGTGSGLALRGTLSQNTTGVPGYNVNGDRFGSSLSAADVNRDGRDDLAVGASGDSEDRSWATGSVSVLYSDGSTLTGPGAQRWTKHVAGVPGDAGSFNLSSGDHPDRFGHQVTLADFNGDARADLAVGAPGAPVTVDGVRKRDAGTVTVLYSDGTRIGTTGATEVSQQTEGMPGTAGQEDGLGTTLAAGDADGNGPAELAAYSPGDTYVTVIPGGSGGLAYTSALGWTQNSADLPDTTEPGDRWGGALRFLDVKGVGQDSLLVGAPGENSRSGAVTVIHPAPTGLAGYGAQWFSQDTTGVPGVGEPGDHFGASL